jgi:hypothetical protein
MAIYGIRRYVDTELSEFSWMRHLELQGKIQAGMRPGQPSPPACGDQGYTIGMSVRRASRKIMIGGTGRDDVTWPEVAMHPSESLRRAQAWYLATFTSAAGRRYTARFGEEQWHSLTPGGRYRLSISVFGAIKGATRMDEAAECDAVVSDAVPCDSEVTLASLA